VATGSVSSGRVYGTFQGSERQSEGKVSGKGNGIAKNFLLLLTAHLEDIYEYASKQNLTHLTSTKPK
jgi:hypothetical protein